MSKKIVIIDYSLGNMFSVQQAFAYLGLQAEVTDDINKIRNADAIVLPGVGAFAEAMNCLNASGLTTEIKEAVAKGKPFLGICLGMQLLFESSEEFGASEGLGLIKGSIKRFAFEDKSIKIPQMGWNKINQPQADKWQGTVLQNVKDGEFMYFVHSYYAVPQNNDDVLCVTEYGGLNYCSAVLHNNIVATQFHPEKSAQEGLKIYENWIKKI